MRALTVLIVAAVIAISIGVTEAQDKQDKVEKAIKEGMAAICRESVGYLWIEKSEKCVNLSTVAYESGIWGNEYLVRRNEE